MANPQIDKIAESSVFKVIAPVLNALLAAVVIGYGGRLVDRLDRMEALLAVAQTDKATIELRVKALEVLVPERTAMLKMLSDKVLMLEFKVEDLQRNPPSKGRQ